jgi:glycosyltransferase involved in cell wall biosynthesis
LRPARLRWYLPYARALAGVDLGAFDIFWAERPHIARLLDRVRARTILDLDDVEHVRIRRGLAFLPKSSLLSRAQLGFRYHLYRRMELVWSRGFLATVVCSEEDRRYLESEGCTNVVVVPNPAPQHPETKTPRTKSDGLRIAFLGNLLHPPNVDSLLYLTREILPLVRQREPGATLEVFGPHASPQLIARCGPGVTFHGFVEDLGFALARCDVFAAPMRFGSGTRVKLLDAMAHGIPIVTTLLGVEGLSMVDREHALIADSPEAFADRLLTLYKDPALAEGLAVNARLLLDRRFRPEVVQEEMARWLLRLIPMRRVSD